MNYYDARIIEGCRVFSYEVKTPDHAAKKSVQRKNSSIGAWKKAILRFLLLMLLPFAFVIDSVVMGVRKILGHIRSFLSGYIRGYVFVTCLVSPVSVTALIPLLCYLL
jgi:hypothetical protein